MARALLSLASPPPALSAGTLYKCPEIIVLPHAAADYTQKIELAFSPWVPGLHVQLTFSANHVGIVPDKLLTSAPGGAAYGSAHLTPPKTGTKTELLLLDDPKGAAKLGFSASLLPGTRPLTTDDATSDV